MSSASDLFRLARTNSDFAKLWGGVTISDLGSSVTNLALPLVAVITLQVGAKEMGFLNAATHLPVLLFALLLASGLIGPNESPYWSRVRLDKDWS